MMFESTVSGGKSQKNQIDSIEFERGEIIIILTT